jgi:hypothetical protein
MFTDELQGEYYGKLADMGHEELAAEYTFIRTLNEKIGHEYSDRGFMIRAMLRLINLEYETRFCREHGC